MNESGNIKKISGKNKTSEKNKGGRSATVLTPEEIKEIEELAGRLTIEQIADYLGIAQTTFYRIMNRQSEVSVAYKKGKQKAVRWGISKLKKKIEEGDAACTIFFVKTQAGWREKQQVDISTDGAALLQPIIIKDDDIKIKNKDMIGDGSKD